MKIFKHINSNLLKKPIITEDDMQLDKIYEVGSRSIGVTFIQKVLNEDIDIDLDPKLKVDGWFGSKTADAVKLYQKNFNLKAAILNVNPMMAEIVVIIAAVHLKINLNILFSCVELSMMSILFTIESTFSLI